MTKGLLASTAEMHNDYAERVAKAISNCSPDAAALTDEYCQFLCDASRELRLKAIEARSVPKSLDYGVDDLLESAENMLEFSQSFADKYAELEKLQRQGKMPTNLQSANRLTEGL